MRYESAALVIVLVLAGIAIGGPLGVYGHCSGWGFGLGWWAKPTPARGLASRAGSGGALSARFATVRDRMGRVAPTFPFWRLIAVFLPPNQVPVRGPATTGDSSAG